MPVPSNINPSQRPIKDYPGDDRWMFWTGTAYRPYADVAEALATVPSGKRHIGLFAIVGNLLYWYKNGITDGDLVAFTAASAGAIWGALTGNLADQTDLKAALDTKLNAADYNDRFKGKYTTLTALQTAHPTANAGDFAQVDAGAGSDVVNYNYDLEEGWVIGSRVASATNTDELPEGTLNLYFTAARAQAAVDISGKVDKVAGKQLSTEDYTTLEKTKLAGIATGAQVNDPNTTLQGNTFNGVSQLVKLGVDGKLPAIDGSNLTNLPASGGGGSSTGIASGTNTYTVACTPTVTALSVNLCIRILFTNGNTGAATINVDGLGAKSIFKGPATALTAGAIVSGQIYELYYDGTVWQLGSIQAVPTAPNKAITTDGGGNLAATYDIKDINSATTETTLLAATWTSNVATVTGVAGTVVYGADYYFLCTGTDTWRRIPWNLTVVNYYLANIDDTAGVKTAAQMNAAYPGVIQGQKVRGANGTYEYRGTFGWTYETFTII